MPTTVIRNADWVIAWDEEAQRHTYRRSVDLAFTDDCIVFLGKGYTTAADRVIDGGGLMVMPGLIDMHTHVSGRPLAIDLLPMYLANGVTTIRELCLHPFLQHVETKIVQRFDLVSDLTEEKDSGEGAASPKLVSSTEQVDSRAWSSLLLLADEIEVPIEIDITGKRA